MVAVQVRVARRVLGFAAVLTAVACGPSTPPLAENLFANGDFEHWEDTPPGSRARSAGWQADRVPLSWTLNPSYPGVLARGSEPATSGESHVTLGTTGDRSAHVYQMLSGLEPGRWYRFGVRVRGGEVSARAYQYLDDGTIDTIVIAEGTGPPGAWREVAGYYRVPDRGWRRSAIALVLARGERVDLDDASLVPVVDSIPGAADVVIENPSARLVFTADARLRELRSIETGTDHATREGAAFATAIRDGVAMPSISLVRSGDRIELGFPDPDVRIVMSVATAPRHFRFEVVDVKPGDLDALRVSISVERLEKVGPAFNATYDDEFGLSFFGTTITTEQTLRAGPGNRLELTVAAGARRGIEGAGMALVAAARRDFEAAIMETERAAGLPCPMLDGEWARESEAVRESYLFAKPVTLDEIDALVDYAKLGGFGAILFVKNTVLANHGHFDIDTESFPGGMADLRRAVDRIHDAGLRAGLHAFGPSISPDDPYVTPVPDSRLATVPGPPLAEALGEHATTVTLASAPALPPLTWERRSFPGRFLRIGDEIIRYEAHVEGPPFRFVDVERGALGTRVASHAAGAEVAGLPALHRFFLPDPDGTLADELTSNFAKVVNGAGFDFVYVDASDGTGEPYIDTTYYMNKLHLDIYRKLDRDVLYQTSLGTGRGLLWHIVPRAASADGRGDIKNYLDERWETILGMEDNMTRADVGWYYWYGDTRPDQMEYICAKVAGVDGSFSLETGKQALEQLPQSRQMLEMVGRWERCRAARAFSDSERAALREPRREFKVFVEDDSCRLYRAVHEEPRRIRSLDGTGSTWVVRHDRDGPAWLGAEIVRPTRDAQGKPLKSPALPGAGRPVLTLNGRTVTFDATLQSGDAISVEGPGPAMHWPRGTAPGRRLEARRLPLDLEPGENTVTLTWKPASAFPPEVEVRLYRVLPLTE